MILDVDGYPLPERMMGDQYDDNHLLATRLRYAPYAESACMQQGSYCQPYVDHTLTLYTNTPNSTSRRMAS